MDIVAPFIQTAGKLRNAAKQNKSKSRGLMERRTVCGGLVGKMSAILPIRRSTTGLAGRRKWPEQGKAGAPGRNRTYDTRFRKPVLYPLSYEGKVPICRDFSLRWPRKGYHKLLIGC